MRLRSIPARTMRSLWLSSAAGRGGTRPVVPWNGLSGVGATSSSGFSGSAARPGDTPARATASGAGVAPPFGRVYRKVRPATADIVVAPRPERAPSERVASAGNRFEVRIRFPEGLEAGDAAWSVEGDVLEVEHRGFLPAYYRNFLVPMGWRPEASVEERELRILLTPRAPAERP